jgi:ribonuclease HI
MLNTDGSCREDGHIGCGGIIRGNDSEWIGGFAKFVGHGNAYLAKLWGVVEGLSYAIRLNLHCVELHVDSMAVVKAITSNGGGGSFRGRSFVDKVSVLNRFRLGGDGSPHLSRSESMRGCFSQYET